MAEEVKTEVAKPTKVRKPTFDTSVGSPVAMRLPDGVRQELEAQAEAEGKTLSELCRVLIEESVANNPDRQLKLLARSLAVAESQLTRAIETGAVNDPEQLDPDDGDGLLSRLRFARESLLGKPGAKKKVSFWDKKFVLWTEPR